MTIDCKDAAGHVRFRVHLYLRTRDGRERIGASGRPDPKFLAVDGTRYAVAPPGPMDEAPTSASEIDSK